MNKMLHAAPESLKPYARPETFQGICFRGKPRDIVGLMKRQVSWWTLLLLFVLPFWVAGCATDPFVHVRKFTPSLLKERDTEAIRRFKQKAGGERQAEGEIIQQFLPQGLDPHTKLITPEKLAYKLGEDQLRRMLGNPDAVWAADDKQMRGHGSFVYWKYNLNVGTTMNPGNALLITLSQGYVVTSEVTGVIRY